MARGGLKGPLTLEPTGFGPHAVESGKRALPLAVGTWARSTSNATRNALASFFMSVGLAYALCATSGGPSPAYPPV